MSNLKEYIAVIHKDADSDFGVSFPDFPGCATAGSTLEEARQMAQEALEFHIEGMREDGDAIPQPSSLDAIHAAGDDGDTFFVIAVRVDEPKLKRVNVMLPEDLIDEVDQVASSQGSSRSAWLATMARHAISGTFKSTGMPIATATGKWMPRDKLTKRTHLKNNNPSAT